MDGRISDLLGCIRDQISLYRDLVEHERRRTPLLVRGSVDSILESIRTEEAFSSRLRSLEMEMTGLCRQLGQEFRIPREEFTLMKLAAKTEPSIALEIRSQVHLFRNLVRQLKSVCQRNRRLIERSLHYGQGLLGMFSNASGSYRQNGFFEQIPSIKPTFSERA